MGFFWWENVFFLGNLEVVYGAFECFLVSFYMDFYNS